MLLTDPEEVDTQIMQIESVFSEFLRVSHLIFGRSYLLDWAQGVLRGFEGGREV